MRLLTQETRLILEATEIHIQRSRNVDLTSGCCIEESSSIRPENLHVDRREGSGSRGSTKISQITRKPIDLVRNGGIIIIQSNIQAGRT